MIQNTVVEDLSAFFPKAKIKSRKSFLDKYDYILSISIEKVYFVKGENVYFKAFWSLRNENSFDDVLNGETSLTLKVGDNYNSYVNELGKLIGQMCEQIAIKINKL